MAGYSRIYCVGEPGGFAGADGINPIYFQILVGDSDRQWLEVNYMESQDRSLRPLGDIRVIIPKGPDDPNTLIDACIAFYPEYFRECPSLERVGQQVRKRGSLDFDRAPHEIPEEWDQLREEARPLFAKLFITGAELVPVDQSTADFSIRRSG